MPNPPYSASVIVLYENQDGIHTTIYHWNDVPEGTPIPKGIIGAHTSMFNAGVDVFKQRMFANRTALINGLGSFVNSGQGYPDTPA
jgi:hypothetical protein